MPTVRRYGSTVLRLGVNSGVNVRCECGQRGEREGPPQCERGGGVSMSRGPRPCVNVSHRVNLRVCERP